MKSIRTLVGIAAAACLTTVVAQAQAGDGKLNGTFGYYTVGETYTIKEQHLLFTGEFSGTYFDTTGQGIFHNVAVTCPGIYDLNYQTDQSSAQGYCIVGTAGGDKATFAWSCKGIPSKGTCDGTWSFNSGTGKFKGISGDATFAAQNVALNEKGRISGYASWKGSYHLP